MRLESITKVRVCLLGLTVFLFLIGCAVSSETRVESQAVADPVVAAENCPQARKTPSAPKVKRDRFNPVYASDITRQMGQKLYENTKPLACKLCHGEQGDGKGDPDFESTPPARNFACAPTMNALSDGQLFWIIRNGSPNTSMPAFSDLPEEDIWTLVFYLRSFSKSQ